MKQDQVQAFNTYVKWHLKNVSQSYKLEYEGRTFNIQEFGSQFEGWWTGHPDVVTIADTPYEVFSDAI